jgi:hypothetical protein
VLVQRWLYKLTPVANRWSEAAPATCCGVCRTCATGTAAGLAIAAAGVGAEALGIRRRTDDEPAGPAEPAQPAAP